MHMVKIHEIHETQSAQISQKQDDHIILCNTKRMYPPGYHHDGDSQDILLTTPHYCVSSLQIYSSLLCPSAGVTIMVIAGMAQCFHVT